ncbi:hypothetical protein THASP1DRAFT_32951, partial [Thamnocephalis sphaerospora]
MDSHDAEDVVAEAESSQIAADASLWQEWQRRSRMRQESEARSRMPPRYRASTRRRRPAGGLGDESTDIDTDTDSIEDSDESGNSASRALVRAEPAPDNTLRGWLVWTLRLGLFHLFIPFLNGVMLGFGEICANE